MERLARWSWLAIAIPILALFGPALASDSSFAFRDAGHFYHPLFQWCAREWAAGRVPLWNPLENCGVPVLADATSSVFYPGKLLFLLPLDFALRYKLYIVLHIVLAAANSFLLARRWNCSPPASALAAIAYSCGGSVVFQYCNVVFLVGAAWLPLAAFFSARLLTDKSWPAAIWFSMVLALMILGGDPQAAVHALLMTALLAMVLQFGERSSLGSFVRRAGLVVSAGVLAALLAAVQVLPSAEATRLSERAVFNRPRSIFEAMTASPLQAETRGQAIVGGLLMTPDEGTHHDLIYDFSVGPWRLVEYLWPNIAGREFPTNRRWMSHLPAEGRVWNPTLYLGLLPLILAVSSFRFFSGGPRSRGLTWTAVVFTLGSFGYYGGGWLSQEFGFFRPSGDTPGLAPPALGVYWFFVTFLPTYALFRYPAKLLPLVALALSQLAARQFDRLWDEPNRPAGARLLLALAIASALAACSVWIAGDAVFGRLNGADSLLGPFDGRGAKVDVVWALLHTAVVALLAWQVLRRGAIAIARRPVWQLAAVVLTAVEIAVANHWLMVTAPAEIWTAPSPVVTRMHTAEKGDARRTPPPRVFRGSLATWRPSHFRETPSANRLAEMARWERQTLFPKHHLDQEIALVEAFSSINSAAYESLLKVAKQHGPQQADKVLLPQPTLLRLLGAEHLVLPDRQQPSFAERQDSAGDDWPESTALWRMRRTLPRAWIVHEVIVMPPLAVHASGEQLDQRSYDVLFPGGRAREFSREAVLETEQPPPAVPSGPALAADEPCVITRYEPQRVNIEADLATPGLLILSDAWYPGWQATVTTGGRAQKAPIYRTNRVLRGVWLPAGKSFVEFRYRPWSFYLGTAVSAATWLGLAALLAARRNRKTGTLPRSKQPAQIE